MRQPRDARRARDPLMHRIPRPRRTSPAHAPIASSHVRQCHHQHFIYIHNRFTHPSRARFARSVETLCALSENAFWSRWRLARPHSRTREVTRAHRRRATRHAARVHWRDAPRRDAPRRTRDDARAALGVDTNPSIEGDDARTVWRHDAEFPHLRRGAMGRDGRARVEEHAL